jgi:hypothetical protein
MKPPGNEKGALLHAPISKLRLQIAYRIAALLATTFGRPFWFLEQKRTSFLDRIDNEAGDDGDNQRSDE